MFIVLEILLGSCGVGIDKVSLITEVFVSSKVLYVARSCISTDGVILVT